MNEPGHQHFDLTTKDYVDKILKPSAQIIRSIDKKLFILSFAVYLLPKENREYFWQNSADYVDIYNAHSYSKWDVFRQDATADLEV